MPEPRPDPVLDALTSPLAEAQLLGGCLLAQRAMSAAVEAGLEEALLHAPAHRHAWTAMRAVWEDGHGTPDVVNTAEVLRQAGLLDAIGGPGYLVELQAEAASATHVPRLVNLLAAKAARRAVYDAGSALHDIAVHGEGDVVDQAERALLGLAEARRAGRERRRLSAPEVAEEALDVIEERSRRGAEVTGLRSGLGALDSLTLGFHPGHLVVLGGVPGVGKTALALQFAALWAAELAEAGEAGVVLYATIEMRAAELGERLLVAQSALGGRGVGSRTARTGRLTATDWGAVNEAAGRVAALREHLDFYDNPETSLAQLRSEAFRSRTEGGLAALVVDFAQIMAPPPGTERANREQQVARNVYGLKVLARDYGCPVVALAQLDREITKKGRRPTMGDFRETAAFEHAADVALAMVPAPEDDPAGPVEVVVLKNRAGERGSAWAAPDWAHYRFTEGDSPAARVPARRPGDEF